MYVALLQQKKRFKMNLYVVAVELQETVDLMKILNSNYRKKEIKITAQPKCHKITDRKF